MASSRLPRGSREYLLARAERLADTIRWVTDRFEAWGARRVIPTTFVDVAGLEAPDEAIAFPERETGRLLALRQDLTEQIRRIVDHELKHLPTPFKLAYLERVWSDDVTHAVRTKERIQAGVEWIGPGPRAEAELLGLAAGLAADLDDARPTLILGHTELRDAWLDALDLAGDRDAAAAALDAKNLSRWRDVGDPAFAGLPACTVTGPGELPPGSPAAVVEIVAGLAELAASLDADVDVVIDPIATAAADYYNGLFFAVASGIAHDPWLRGGRYDGRFDTPADALGFALDLDSLMDAADQGRMRCPRTPRVLWTPEEPPPGGSGVRWLPMEAGIDDPRAWAKAHGLDGVAEAAGGGYRVVDPATGEPKPNLEP